jgi:hypothetical protein
MEILLVILALLVAMAIFDIAALGWGVDSRRESDDPHAPLMGAH